MWTLLGVLRDAGAKVRKNKTLSFIGRGSIGGLLLVGFIGGPSASGAESPNDTVGVDAMLRQVVDDSTSETMNASETAGANGPHSQFADLYLGSELVDSGTIVIRYNAKSPKAGAFATTVMEASKSAPLKLELTGVDLDPGALRRLASDISAGGAQWLKTLGVRDIQAVEINELTGELTVRASGGGSPAKVTVNGVKITVDSGAAIDFQTRAVDSKPWSGGATTKTSGGASCTAGFNWQKWGTAEKMGSTAEHCYEATGVSTWSNSSTSWGTRYYYNGAKDTFLARSAPQSQFNNTVFVGGPTTNDIRSVTSTGNDVSGAVVAFGGGVSNYSSGTISGVTFYAGGKGPWRLTTVVNCTNGDSGGPWLTAHSNLTINAMGQHGGYYDSRDRWGCFYMPQGEISAALSASVLLQ